MVFTKIWKGMQNMRRYLFSDFENAKVFGKYDVVVIGAGMAGLYCLVAISAFMSLMFPTIYGIALENVESRDTSLGAAFLVMAIVGGAVMPPLQGLIIDQGTVAAHPAVNVSFVLPFICFLIITVYSIRAYGRQKV